MIVLSHVIVINGCKIDKINLILIMMLKDKLMEMPIFEIGICRLSIYTNFNITTREQVHED